MSKARDYGITARDYGLEALKNRIRRYEFRRDGGMIQKHLCAEHVIYAMFRAQVILGLLRNGTTMTLFLNCF